MHPPAAGHGFLLRHAHTGGRPLLDDDSLLLQCFVLLMVNGPEYPTAVTVE